MYVCLYVYIYRYRESIKSTSIPVFYNIITTISYRSFIKPWNMAKLNYIQFSFHIKYTLLQLVTLQRQNVRLTVISLLKAPESI